jgi:hypothetical protein
MSLSFLVCKTGKIEMPISSFKSHRKEFYQLRVLCYYMTKIAVYLMSPRDEAREFMTPTGWGTNQDRSMAL